VAVAATIMLATFTSGAAAASYKTCAGSFDPTGAAGGGFFRDIRAKRVTCRTARSVTRAWVIAHPLATTNHEMEQRQGLRLHRTVVFHSERAEGFTQGPLLARWWSTSGALHRQPLAQFPYGFAYWRR
jgi:hypothetical protein